jgi:hypothetical protein
MLFVVQGVKCQKDDGNYFTQHPRRRCCKYSYEPFGQSSKFLRGPSSSAGIVTVYGLDGPGINSTSDCKECGSVDTLSHRLTECGEGKNIWEGTMQRIAWIMRTTLEHILAEWLLRPHFQIWPPWQNRAVLWILAHMVWYVMKEWRLPSVQDYWDFMRREQWKVERQVARRDKLGNYLVVL